MAVNAVAGETASPNASRYFTAMNPSAGVELQNTSDATIRIFNSQTNELYSDVMAASVTAQRIFARSLPSIADYSQTAHMVGATADANGAYCAPGAKWVMWDTPFLAHESRRRNDGYLGYKNTVSGFATGLSRMLGETTAIGIAVGYDGRKLTNKDSGYHWRNKADAFHAAIYGGTALGCFFIDGYAGYSRSWQRTERDVYYNNNGQDLQHGNFNDTVLSAGLKASYVWILPNEVRITPSIGLDYSHISRGSFTEKGASGFPQWAMNKSSHDSLQMPVMVSANRTFTSNFLTFGGVCSLWTPEVRAGYVPQFGAKRIGSKGSLASGGSRLADGFVGNSNEFGGSYGTAGVGLKIKLRDKYIFAVDYDYTFGSKYNNHVVTGTYGVSF